MKRFFAVCLTAGIAAHAAPITGGPGDRMPPTDPAYYDRATDELALVRTWIENGAPHN